MPHTTAVALSPTVNPDALQRAFLTALLLTGNTSSAEAAVREALAEYGGSLILRTVNASLRMLDPTSSDDLESARKAVPLSLQTILSLERLPRQCFVLRVLLSLPRRECALLLNISEHQVGSYSGAAASTLSQMK